MFEYAVSCLVLDVFELGLWLCCLIAIPSVVLKTFPYYSRFHITFPRRVAKFVEKLGTRFRSSQLRGELDNQIVNFKSKFPTSAGVRLSRVGGWVVGRGSWVVGRGSWVVGRGSWVVGRGSWVAGRVCLKLKKKKR